MDFTMMTASAAGGAVLVVALVEATKRVLPDLSQRWWPLVAILWGLFLALVWANLQGTDYREAGITGLVAGLMAMGLYSGRGTVGIGGSGGA